MADTEKNNNQEFWYNLKGDNFRVLKPEAKPKSIHDTEHPIPDRDDAEWDRLPF